MKKNQGFSLVELIVVIAIMAVLVGVLAPAYLRYVEKSRKSTDVSSISDIMAAAEKVAIDPQFDLAAGSKFTLSGTGTLSMDVTVASTDADNPALDEWKAIAGNGYTCKSKEFKAVEMSFEGTLQPAGNVTWEIDAEKLIAFSPDFAKKWQS
jgi:prepilin-type N-terminal cleavage/methylation domain